MSTPPGDTPAERVANFLALYGGDTMQYLYPEPGKQWNLPTEDVRRLLYEHQVLSARVQKAQNFAVNMLISKLLELNLTIDLITKRTNELRPGDVVETEHGFLHRIIKTIEPARGGFDIRFVHPISIPAPYGAWAEAEDEWQVIEPSKLDLAVQRAQELADQYPEGGSFLISGQLKDFSDLLKMFRAAR